ncbi:tetratricopeptide repeat protein [Candidatus Obscuribacterales bacterium]|nr:tetratricopeptide repeat protein [Candidatus Obscuribacterales bacterium]MBX3152178.1 tetratricopeptide repeat protein [Candidatus Obscuribacterales bacterium]
MSFFKPKQSTNKPQDVMIGELLVKAQIISQKQLDDCVRQSGMKRLHLGQMLMMSGYITPRDLQAAMDAQTMLRDNLIDGEMAVKCLRMAYKQGLTFADVVNNQQAIDQEKADSAVWTLGHLLHEADVATQMQLDAAYQRSNATNIPTGRILILNGVINEHLLSRALDLLVKARDEVCTREEAVEAMRVAAGMSPGTPLTQSLLLPSASKRPRLGQLMLAAGIMSETDVMNAVEFGLTYNIMIGQVMVEQGYVSVHMVEAALELQRYVEDGQIDEARAGDVLEKVYHGNGNVNDLITSLQPVLRMAADSQPKLSFEKLLTLARVVSQEQIHEAFDICRQTPEALAKILCLTGFIEASTHDSVLRCHELLESGRLTQDDALVALDYCFSKSTGFDEALSDLGWSDHGLAHSEHAQLAHEQEFDPDRTADEMPVLAGDAVPGFNLLDHFGLGGGDSESTEAEEPAVADEPEEYAPAAPGADEEEQQEPEPEPVAEEQDDNSWALPDDSGEGPSLSSMGVATSDIAVISFTEQILEDPMSNVAEPPGGKLANILDRLADGEEEDAAPASNGSSSSENGDSAVSSNGGGNGAGALPPPKELKKLDPADARPLGPLGRVRPDRNALREQEMTIAPQRMKIDEAQLLSKTEMEAVPEPETDKKAAVGAAMYRLAESYFEQGDFSEAQKIYEKILAIRQAELGSQHIELVDDLNKLAEVLWVQGNFRQAEPFVRRAVTILETTQPVDPLRLAEGLRILAGLFFQQGKFEPSIPFLEHALLLKKASLGEDHRDVGNLLREYAKLLKKMGRTAEAEKHYLQAKKILAKNPEPEE